MLESREQKQTLAVVAVLVISLIGVSLWNRHPFNYVDSTKTSRQNQDVENARKYLAYLNSLKVDKQASKDLFESIITQKEIQQEVTNALKANEKMVIPQISDATIKQSSASNKQAVETYLTKTVGNTLDFNSQSMAFQTALFTGDQDSVLKARQELGNLQAKLSKTEVPKEAIGIHKALSLALVGYNGLLEASQNFDAGNYENNDQVWPKVYQSYTIINQAAKEFSDGLNKLAGKYQIAYINLPIDIADGVSGPKNPFIKTAHAFLGIGDVTITVGDIPRIIMDAVKEGLRSAFVSFMGTMLNKLIAKIESNYMIANFLYYSDALVAGQYTDDYLNKYVSDNVDRQIIKRFIPQLSCGANTADLKPVFEAKAKDYLGFTPANISPSDPQYYQKMASVGDFLASPNGWQLYFEDLAEQTESEAEKNADRELTSSGLKAARDQIKSNVAKSVSSIVSAQRASFTALLQLGAQNAEGIISGFVAQLTQTLVNNFVFKGVTGGPASGVGVLKEQATCVAVAQLQPVLALDSTEYVAPPAPPTVDQVFCQQNPTNSACLPR